MCAYVCDHGCIRLCDNVCTPLYVYVDNSDQLTDCQKSFSFFLQTYTYC